MEKKVIEDYVKHDNFIKRILTAIYIFIFVFIAVVLYLMAIFDMDEPVALIALVTAIATSEQVVSAQIKCKKIQAAVDINAPDSNEDDCGGADDGEEVELMMVVPRKKKKKGR